MKKVKITLLWRRESLTEVGGSKEFSLVFRRSQTLWVGYRSLAYTAVLQIFGSSDLFRSGLFEEDRCFSCVPYYAFMKLFVINGVYMKALGNWKIESGFVKHWLNSV